MEERTVTVKDKIGLHARTSSLFSKKAMMFASEVKIVFGQKEANGKSMLAIMSLGVKHGMEIKIKVNGEDEKKTAELLAEFVENNFA